MGFMPTLAIAHQGKSGHCRCPYAPYDHPFARNRSFEKLMFLVEQAHWFYEVWTHRLCIV